MKTKEGYPAIESRSKERLEDNSTPVAWKKNYPAVEKLW